MIGFFFFFFLFFSTTYEITDGLLLRIAARSLIVELNLGVTPVTFLFLLLDVVLLLAE
jgi:hypothetical protein